MFGHTSEVRSPHQNKVHCSYQYITANSFRGRAPTFAQPQSFTYFSVWTIKSPSVFSPNCKLRDISPPYFYACQTIRNCLGTFERVRQSVIRSVHACFDSGGHFEYSL